MAEFQVNKTFAEINRKIKQGEAVVVMAEEMIGITPRAGRSGGRSQSGRWSPPELSASCVSSGEFLNFGHTRPRMKAHKVYLNEVEASGVAAMDVYWERLNPDTMTP